MGRHRTLRCITSVARQPQKDMASGLAATTDDNNMEWASSWTGPESSRSSAAHQFPAKCLQSASQVQIQAYALTSAYDDDLVEEFYEQPENTIKEITRKDLLIVQGDWNAKIAPGAFEQWAGTVRRLGVGETNERGKRLQEFAHSHKMTMVNLDLEIFPTPDPQKNNVEFPR